MLTDLDLHPEDSNGSRHELTGLVRRIQTLTAELDELRRHEAASPTVRAAKERMLEQLRWQTRGRRATHGNRRPGRAA